MQHRIFRLNSLKSGDCYVYLKKPTVSVDVLFTVIIILIVYTVTTYNYYLFYGGKGMGFVLKHVIYENNSYLVLDMLHLKDERAYYQSAINFLL